MRRTQSRRGSIASRTTLALVVAASLVPVIDGREGERSAPLTPQSEQYFDVPLQPPPAAPAPLLEAFSRTVTDKVFEPVDMQLLRDVREAHENPDGISPAQYDALLARFRVHFGDPEWKPRAEFGSDVCRVSPGYFRVSDALFAELEAGFTRYVDELDRGPRLARLRNVDYAFTYGVPNWGAAPVDHRGASFLNPVRDGGPGEPPQVPVPPEELPDPYWVNEETRWGYYPWGDHQGNRANRFIAGIAYLDGEQPSAIMGRGYYARATVAAYTLEHGKLVLGATFDSEAYPDPDIYHHKGAQTITMSDVDLDDKDEIVFGALILDDDLSPRNVAGTWFPFPVPEANVNLTQPMHHPDADDRFNYLGHGDATSHRTPGSSWTTTPTPTRCPRSGRISTCRE